MNSQVKFTLFVLLAFAAALTSAQTQTNINLANYNPNNNPRLWVDHSREWSWTDIPASLQRIGGNGNGDYHYHGALQFASQIITDHAVSLGVFTTSRSSMTSRTSRAYTFSASQVGRYVIGLIIQSANGEIINASFTAVISNSGNWWIDRYSFTYLINYNGAVANIQASYITGRWSYTLLNSNYNAGNNRVWNLPLPPLNNAQSYNPYFGANGWNLLSQSQITNGQDLQWIISYGANYALTQGYNNAARNMTVGAPSSFVINTVYNSYQKNTNGVWDYKIDVNCRYAGAHRVRLNFQANRQIDGNTGEDTLQLYSWAINLIELE